MEFSSKSKTPRNSLYSATSPHRSLNSSPEPCPLEDPDLPPVSELNHLVDQCYCHLCTCEAHKCPATAKRLFLSSVFKGSSRYQLDYKKHPYSPAHFHRRIEAYSPKDYKSNYITTTQADFRPYSMNQRPLLKQTASAGSFPVRFSSRSSYQANFPNWGANYAGKVTEVPCSYRGDEVKFKGKSVYSSEFDGKPLPKCHADNVLVEMLQKTRESWTVGTQSDSMFRQSHFQMEFRPIAMPQRPPRAKGADCEYISPQSWANQYNTTYQGDFLGSPVKRFSKKRGIIRIS